MNADHDIGPGMLLASAPMIWDPNFRRTVILLCETGEQGSFGLVLNRPLPFQSDEITEMLHGQHPELFLGGPVQPDTLHYIHSLPDVISEGTLLGEDVYWGGDFASLQEASGDLDFAAVPVRFFLGYSGWGEGQLEGELSNHDWIVAPLQRQFVFETEPDSLWSNVVASLGGDYSLFANFPANPQLN